VRRRVVLFILVAAGAAIGWLAWIAVTPGLRVARASADGDAKAGREVYVRYCATCHGDAGRGDGASAASFATKPADLTDGRLMNGLPDEFLQNIILHGGPAEGLSPGMPPLSAYLGDADTRQVIQYLRTIASPPFRPEAAKPIVTAPHAPRQPIFFNHVIHAGSFQIPCQYCHADARRSEYAGLPSVERCLGCHKIIGAQDNPEIQKIHGYARRGQPIPWVRIFRLPEFTYFTHRAHVRSGLECQTCHGPIERMRVVGADTGPKLSDDLLRLVGFRPAPRPLSMGWCIECHREQNATRGTHAPLECVTCHH
jgi:mono/diheme cytochrome c family protein